MHLDICIHTPVFTQCIIQSLSDVDAVTDSVTTVKVIKACRYE